MKKVKKFLMTLLPSFFVVGMCLPVLLNSNKNQIEDPGEDTAIYDRTLTHANLNRPDILSADDDEDEEETVKVDKVVLHYYNEAGGCDGRAFYLWVTGELVYYPIFKSNAKQVYSMVNSVGTYFSLNTDVTISYSTIGNTYLGYRYLGIDGLPGGSLKFNDYDLLTESGKYQFVESGDDLILNRKVGLKITDTESDYWFKESTEKYALYFYKDTVNPKQEGWTDVVSRARDSGTYRHDFYIQAWYPSIIFVRINNGTNTGHWDNAWNQSDDIDLTDGYSATNYINSKNKDWWNAWTGTWSAS